jgi:hypothetical protein
VKTFLGSKKINKITWFNFAYVTISQAWNRFVAHGIDIKHHGTGTVSWFIVTPMIFLNRLAINPGANVI